MPVRLSNLPNDASFAPPAIHALAARKIIQDFEDGHYNDILKASHPEADLRRVVRAHIVRLGTTYCIGSSQTSFVAVDEQSFKGKGREGRFLDIEAEVPSDEPPVPQPAPRRGGRTKQTARRSTGGKAPRRQMAVVEADATGGDIDVLEALARLQSFDGSFLMKVLNVVKDGLTDDHAKAAFPGGTAECVVATALVLAFISTKLEGDGSEDTAAWQGIYQKAHDFLESELGAEVADEVIQKAATLL